MRITKSLAIVPALALTLTACGEATEAEAPVDGEGTEEVTDEGAEQATGNIVEVASANSDFSTLVTAVAAADLVETLSGDGPFTVFAPNDAAFAKLGDALAELTKPEAKDTLTGILTYHVVSGEVKAADVLKLIEENGGKAEITTVNGGILTASLDGENVVLTDANGGTSTILATDVAATNGVIHVIDTVVTPAG
ncbi:fasciclin domain-containing protein [Parasphingorhabdus sp. DH2-15]|jgi:uncharacterized surface protein with fasciclin (FAS1) repeats|uniref:fasciclin domain-containing protein n=1 Tax=Parasphingorhabdus sp. DH2-15 TaxID=3444112 RepID=UPI003F6855F2